MCHSPRVSIMHILGACLPDAPPDGCCRMHRHGVLQLVLPLLLLLGALGLAKPAYAATIAVSTPTDEFGTGAGCSLREAIQAANTNAPFGGCPAGSGDDTITLPSGTYILNLVGADDLNQSGDLDVRSNITINGAGAATTIVDGNATDRVLDMILGAAFSLSNITIRNGRANGTGGGINVPSNGATVTISNSVISGNTTTAANGHGGGIDNSGVMTIADSTIGDNRVTGSSGNGGGIDNSGTLTLTNSTVSGNLASGNAGRGGGIANQNGTANVTFTTITGNSATKGGGGILANGGQVNLRATIVETSPLESTCDEQSGGDIVSQGSNVADDGTCFTGGLNGDQVVDSALLGPLTNNGGPTQTHLPQVDSPAIIAVLSECPPPPTDQRGVTRPSGARCDVGAVERAAGALQLSSSTYSVQENGGAATIAVTRTGSTTGDAGATLTLSGGTATAGADYTGTSFAVTFADGETSKTISVPIVDDALDEDDETVNVTLSSPTGGAAIGTPAAAVLTIVDDDALPTLSMSNASAPEGNAGTTGAVFTATLGAPSGRPVTVQVQTVDGTATAGTDYVAVPPTTVVFKPGETVKTGPIVVLGDLLNEPDETFLGVLSNPTNATIAVGQGVGTIVDDDDPPALSIDDAIVIEGSAASTNVQFTVRLSAASGRQVTVQAQTANGTATAGSDYTPPSPTTVTFSPGETEKTVTVAVLGDLLDEPDETFLVNLSNPSSAFIENREGVGTIVDDDGPPTLRISGATVIEGDAGTVDAVFTVQLLPVSGQEVTVMVQTADGTATAGSDYTALPPTTLRFPPGTTAQTIAVKVNGDVVDEPDQTFVVRLSGPQNATIATPEAVGTIQDDDAPEVQITDVTVVEGDSGSVNAEFTVSLKAPSDQTVVVDAVVVDGTTTAGTDYTPPGPIRLTFPPGTISQLFIVAVTGDLLDEPDETSAVNLTAVGTLRGGLRAALFKAQGIGTIVDDDTAGVALHDVTVVEGDSGSVDAVFTVSLTTPSSEAVTVVAQTADGTATAGLDYSAVGPVTLTFPAGTISQAFTVPVLGDLLDETDETFSINLTGPSHGRTDRAQGLATIRDDDTAILSVDNVAFAEGDIGSEDAVFTVRLSTPSTRAVTVVVQTSDGTAMASADYTAVGPITLTFAPGVTSQTVAVPVLGDIADEPNETFTVTLSGASNATIGTG